MALAKASAGVRLPQNGFQTHTKAANGHSPCAAQEPGVPNKGVGVLLTEARESDPQLNLRRLLEGDCGARSDQCLRVEAL